MAVRPVPLLVALPVVAIGELGGLLAEPAGPMAFNRDVRPVLSRRCFACHGPDEDQRMGGGDHGLRLDTRDGALDDLAGYADDPPRTIWAYRDHVGLEGKHHGLRPRRPSPMARPTNLASAWSKTRSSYTTCKPRSCTCSASITSG
jgi:hypothetical protein